jgi:vitamin D 1,25-hydroxylase
MSDPNFPSMNPSQAVPNNRAPLSKIDNAHHRRIRGLVASNFTLRAARKWQPVSERIVAEQLAALLRDGPPADLATRFALPVPLRLICRMLGVPDRDIDFVTHHARMIITRASETSQPSNLELYDYMEKLVLDNEARPDDGLIGQWVVRHLRTGAMTHEDLVRLARFLVVAGHTTTAATIGLSVLSLLEEPDRYRALHDNPALAVPLVEEFLRFQTIASDGNPRVAKRDLTLGGVTIRAGEGVIISLSSANQDEEVFTDPDSFQPDRANLHRHVAFGWGSHRCLGQHFARMELRVALTALACTIPTLRLAVPLEQLRFGQRERHLNHVKELPVTW